MWQTRGHNARGWRAGVVRASCIGVQTSRDDVAGTTPDFLLEADLVDVRRVAPDALIARAVAGARSALWRGAHAVLATLNSRTRFRFTGLYRVEAPVLRNVALFDRENPMLRAAGECSALRDTYCNIVAANALALAIANAAEDGRVIGHPARASVLSYIGVPVRNQAGRVVGTLCHWDLRPRLAPAGELIVLERVAALLAPLVGLALTERERDTTGQR